MAGAVLLLSGAPGAGRTTVAHLLAHATGRPGVPVEAERFWGMVGTGRMRSEVLGR